MKRLTQRIVATAFVLGAVTAVTPVASAEVGEVVDLSEGVDIGEIGTGTIGGGGTPECRQPEVGWNIHTNPPSAYVYADPGRICAAT